jgi:hypothetical protein
MAGNDSDHERIFLVGEVSNGSMLSKKGVEEPSEQ